MGRARGDAMTYTLLELFEMYDEATARAQRQADYRGYTRAICIAKDRHARKYQRYDRLAGKLRRVLRKRLDAIDQQTAGDGVK